MTLDDAMDAYLQLVDEGDGQALTAELAAEDERLRGLGGGSIAFRSAPTLRRLRLKMALRRATAGPDADQLIRRISAYEGPLWRALTDCLRIARREWRRRGGL